MGDPLRYAVDLSLREQHLVRVTLTVPEDLAPGARLVLPTWTPGSYVMRDYVHHLQRIDARTTAGDPVALAAAGHSGWTLPGDVAGPVDVTYELYANDLTVRTNHVDDHHALLVGAATFVLVAEGRDRPHEITITPTPGHRVWGLLPGDGTTFRARDADHLVDAAFEVGDLPATTVEARGVPHTFVWAGHGGVPDLARIARDVQGIAEVATELFDGDLPVEEYTFLCVGWDAGGGGLEHRDGSVLMVPVHSFTDADAYARFQSLVAHEYLHLWNVKRLVPRELVRPDLVAHTHTTSLWVAEGWTAYYDELLPLRAGQWTVERFLKTAAEQLDRVLDRPGAALQSVEESSYHAWTKQYVRDENSLNAGVDYYGHGAVLAWYLDLVIRRERPDTDGLDDALRVLWQRFGGTGSGYTDDDVRAAVAAVAGRDVGDVFDRHVRGRELPPIEELVSVVGLQVTRATDDDTPPHLGAQLSEDDRGITVAAVHRDGPAWRAGITGGDRLVAVDGQTVGRGLLPAVLRGHAPGTPVAFTVVRGPRLLRRTVELAAPRPARRLTAVAQPDARQRAAFRRWTGQDLPS